MSRIRGVFGYELVSKNFIHWLSKYEHEFLGWASCPTLPYDSYRVEFARTLRFKISCTFSNPHPSPPSPTLLKNCPHPMPPITTYLSPFIYVALSNQYNGRVSSVKPFSRIMINHSVNNEPAVCVTGISVSVRLNIHYSTLGLI